MIIRQNSILSLSEFTAGLEQAAKGVFLFSAGSDSNAPASRSTAWLITDELIVVPEHAVPDFHSKRQPEDHGSINNPAWIYCSEIEEPLEAKYVSSSSGKVEGSLPFLLRLKKPLPGQALMLGFENLELEEQIFLIHCPNGEKNLHISFGRIKGFENEWLDYDADTVPGSGGAPIFRLGDRKVIGMHVRSSPNTGLNQGVGLNAMINTLREMPEWSEIASFHQLADVKAASQAIDIKTGSEPPLPQKELIAAAVQWDFNPQSFSTKVRELLKPLVNNPSSEDHWIMRTGDRQRLLGSTSVDELRRALKVVSTKDERQNVIRQILSGQPFRLDKIPESLLPYWLQAVRWFAGAVDNLPSAAEINRELERRRVKSRLQAIKGSEFRGREKELSDLDIWYRDDAPGAMIVTGIGGVGKSALLAYFALRLDQRTPLLWLDFDRADLAPDDAVSVLKILYEQVSVQLGDFEISALDESSWTVVAGQIGQKLKSLSDPLYPPLLILDGFEIAQHVKEHHEIWQILEIILRDFPKLRVVVSGRAPVKNLKLLQRESKSLDLQGMSEPHAQKWLAEHKVTDPQSSKRIFELTKGIPLKLKLAIRFIETAGSMEDLPAKLPDVLVEGFLYQRVLDRVIDPLLKEVSHDALVLRSLTKELIGEVLSDRIPPGLTAEDIFARLAQEFALVMNEENLSPLLQSLENDTEILHIRPELRSATLKLLEQENPKRVRLIDRRAAKWYARQDLTSTHNCAELVYHRLRLRDLEGAEKAWRKECAPLLKESVEELPENAVLERKWLSDRLKQSPAVVVSQDEWENDALKRIRAALQRGLVRGVAEILNERKTRQPGSPLVVYDAWVLWNNNETVRARELLNSAPAQANAANRTRDLFAAFLAVKAKDFSNADQLLAQNEEPHSFVSEEPANLEQLAIRAARVRLTVDLASELRLYTHPNLHGYGEIPVEPFSDYIKFGKIDQQAVKELDLIIPLKSFLLPDLTEITDSTYSFEIFGQARSPKVPTNLSELSDFKQMVLNGWFSSPFGLKKERISGDSKIDPWNPTGLHIEQFSTNLLTKERDLILKFTGLVPRRVYLATSDLFLAQTCELALRPETIKDPLSNSVIATLAAFRGEKLTYLGRNGIVFEDFDELLQDVLKRNPRIVISAPDDEQIYLAEEILKTQQGDKEINEILMWVNFIYSSIRKKIENPIFEQFPKYLLNYRNQKNSLNNRKQNGLYSIIMYLLGPDPLEMLCKRALGFPDNFKL